MNMKAVWILVVMVLAPICAAIAQDKHFKGSMFSDLEVVTSRSQTKGDTIYKFHVSEEEHNIPSESMKRYFWFHQGEMRSTVGNYSGKLLHGGFEKFDRKGNLYEKGEFNNGLKTGEWLTWFPNGRLSRRVTWQNGLRKGKYEEFQSSGDLYKQGSFRKGLLDGTMYVYGPKGSVIGEERYKNGKLIEWKPISTSVPSRSDTSKTKKKKGLFRKRDKEVLPSDTIKTKKQTSPKQPATVDPTVVPPTQSEKTSKKTRKKSQKDTADPQN
jgi:hypothetical protein